MSPERFVKGESERTESGTYKTGKRNQRLVQGQDVAG
jgi:hypothetical protein